MNISMLFTIGGDGTLRAADEIYDEVARRGLKIAIVGIPKTIDNDISYVQKTFGLETAFSVAGQAIRSAHIEAKGAPYGLGLVKIMGRLSGFVAANAALALNEVNFVLIPEVPFDLDGPNGLYAALERRFQRKDHAVIAVAEGAGQAHLKPDPSRKDASGNQVLGDIGVFLRDALVEHFRRAGGHTVSLKYIDPSYMVRAAAANCPRRDILYPARPERRPRGHGGQDGDAGGQLERPLHARASQDGGLEPQDAVARGSALAQRAVRHRPAPAHGQRQGLLCQGPSVGRRRACAGTSERSRCTKSCDMPAPAPRSPTRWPLPARRASTPTTPSG